MSVNISRVFKTIYPQSVQKLFEFNQKSLVVTKFVSHKYGVEGVCRHDSKIDTEIDKILKDIRINQIFRK